LLKIYVVISGKERKRLFEESDTHVSLAPHGSFCPCSFRGKGEEADNIKASRSEA
jgi:hypothetical protein